MSISEIVNYVNRTPHNTNPNVIASMVQGANEQAVYESVEELKQDGGVGYTEKGKVLTFDGNTQGKELFDGAAVHVSDTVYDLNAMKSATLYLLEDGDEEIIDISSFTVQPIDNTGNQIMIATCEQIDLDFVALTVSKSFAETNALRAGTYIRFIDNEFVKFYVSRIEFEDAVHTIDSKYLPDMSGGMPVFDFTDLKDAWEPFEENENIMCALIPVERAAEAVQSIYSLFASKKYTPVTVAIQLYDDILILPCAVAMQEGDVRLCGETSFGTEGSIYVIVTLSNTDVVKPHIMLQMA